MRLLPNVLFVVVALLFLAGVGWYLLSTTQIVEAPTEDLTNRDTGEPSVPLEVNNFDDCVAAGNPVMESYPRQCRHEGILYIEEIETPFLQDERTMCSPESKLAEVCTMEYAPVCGLVEVQCITTPCNPVPETFSNACAACSQGNVISYTEGECSLNVQ